jgi:hypothetical protein
MPSAAINESNYLSVPRIARELRRHKVSVYRAIERLRVPFAFELDGFKFYSRAALTKIERGMRRRNGMNGNGSVES